MSRIIRVDLEGRPYDITIGRAVPVTIPGKGSPSVMLVTDSHVDPLQGSALMQELQTAGHRVIKAVVPAGESSKCLDQASYLYGEAIDGGLDRHSVIVALGGGMVGDLAGFVAATLFRGIRLVQVPTTLLSLVDSSVGGKTAINLPHGKNLVGVFHQPVSVTADLARLASLPQREYVSGLAEVIKYGVIWDADLFATLETSVDALLNREPAILEAVVARCCEIKAAVVAKDERESGLRAILNFGHTMAHALEQTSGYGAWLHGEAVASGMVYAARLSSRILGLHLDSVQRLETLVRRCGLPVGAVRSEGRDDRLGRPSMTAAERDARALPGTSRADEDGNFSPAGDATPWRLLRNAMDSDKKSVARIPRFVLAREIGAVEFGCDVSEQDLESVYEVWRCLR